MRTSEAVSKIRQEIGLNQDEFAERLKVTKNSVSRYENGQEPSHRVSLILTELATEANLPHLAELFSVKRKSAITNRVQGLSRPGAARPVPPWELNYWLSKITLVGAGYIRLVLETTEKLERLSQDPETKGALAEVNVQLEEVIKEICLVANGMGPYLEDVEPSEYPREAMQDLERMWRSKPALREVRDLVRRNNEKLFGKSTPK